MQSTDTKEIPLIKKWYMKGEMLCEVDVKDEDDMLKYYQQNCFAIEGHEVI